MTDTERVAEIVYGLRTRLNSVAQRGLYEDAKDKPRVLARAAAAMDLLTAHELADWHGMLVGKQYVFTEVAKLWRMVAANYDRSVPDGDDAPDIRQARERAIAWESRSLRLADALQLLAAIIDEVK